MIEKIVGLFKGAPAPTPEPTLEARAAEAQRRHAELKERADERNRLNGIALAASAAKQRAHEALSRIITDPMAFATALDDELALLKAGLRDTAAAESEAWAKHNAHQQEFDLGAEAKRIAHDSQLLEQERLKREDRADVDELIAAGARFKAVHERMERRRAYAYFRWQEHEIHYTGLHAIERGAGLPEVSFEPGIFDEIKNPFGAMGSAWRNDVLVKIKRAYPDIELPAEDAEAVEKLAHSQARWFARVAWTTNFVARRIREYHPPAAKLVTSSRPAGPTFFHPPTT